MLNKIRIILADDHRIFREGFAAMFRDHPDIELLDQASNGEQLLLRVQQLRPDVVLTDIQMEPVDGFEATHRIHEQYPEIAVIALSMYEDNYSIMEMLKAGACGYLVKNAGREQVVEAIKAASQGETYYCRSASKKIAALIASGRYNPSAHQTPEYTPTELRILHLLCQGLDSKEIAEKLNISPVTTTRYRMQLLEKAGVKNATALVIYALRNGLVRW